MKGTVSKSVVWSAADYASNSAVQHTWARELIAKLDLRGDERILDVGCGDGKVTAEMAHAVPKGSVVGVDASSQMIEFATKTFSIPNLEFRTVDAREIKPAALSSPSPPPKEERAGVRRSIKPLTPALSPLGRGEGDERTPALFDVVFSNAALHWVDDHQAFLRGAASVLKPDGRLLVSCGGKGNAHDVFLALRPVMRQKRWREFFRKMEAPYFFHSPEEYKKWLLRFGFQKHSVKLTPKDVTYAGREGFATWLRTTWIPYTQRVPENLREEFIASVAERYIGKHPMDARGMVPVRMVRLEIDAVRI